MSSVRSVRSSRSAFQTHRRSRPWALDHSISSSNSNNRHYPNTPWDAPSAATAATVSSALKTRKSSSAATAGKSLRRNNGRSSRGEGEKTAAPSDSEVSDLSSTNNDDNSSYSSPSTSNQQENTINGKSRGHQASRSVSFSPVEVVGPSSSYSSSSDSSSDHSQKQRSIGGLVKPGASVLKKDSQNIVACGVSRKTTPTSRSRRIKIPSPKKLLISPKKKKKTPSPSKKKKNASPNKNNDCLGSAGGTNLFCGPSATTDMTGATVIDATSTASSEDVSRCVAQSQQQQPKQPRKSNLKPPKQRSRIFSSFSTLSPIVESSMESSSVSVDDSTGSAGKNAATFHQPNLVAQSPSSDEHEENDSLLSPSSTTASTTARDALKHTNKSSQVLLSRLKQLASTGIDNVQQRVAKGPVASYSSYVSDGDSTQSPPPPTIDDAKTSPTKQTVVTQLNAIRQEVQSLRNDLQSTRESLVQAQSRNRELELTVSAKDIKIQALEDLLIRIRDHEVAKMTSLATTAAAPTTATPAAAPAENESAKRTATAITRNESSSDEGDASVPHSAIGSPRQPLNAPSIESARNCVLATITNAATTPTTEETSSQVPATDCSLPPTPRRSNQSPPNSSHGRSTPVEPSASRKSIAWANNSTALNVPSIEAARKPAVATITNAATTPATEETSSQVPATDCSLSPTPRRSNQSPPNSSHGRSTPVEPSASMKSIAWANKTTARTKSNTSKSESSVCKTPNPLNSSNERSTRVDSCASGPSSGVSLPSADRSGSSHSSVSTLNLSDLYAVDEHDNTITKQGNSAASYSPSNFAGLFASPQLHNPTTPSLKRSKEAACSRDCSGVFETTPPVAIKDAAIDSASPLIAAPGIPSQPLPSPCKSVDMKTDEQQEDFARDTSGVKQALFGSPPMFSYQQSNGRMSPFATPEISTSLDTTNDASSSAILETAVMGNHLVSKHDTFDDDDDDQSSVGSLRYSPTQRTPMGVRLQKRRSRGNTRNATKCTEGQPMTPASHPRSIALSATPKLLEERRRLARKLAKKKKQAAVASGSAVGDSPDPSESTLSTSHSSSACDDSASQLDVHCVEYADVTVPMTVRMRFH